MPLIIKLQEKFSRFEQPDLVNKNDSQALGVHLGPHQLDIFFFSKKAQVLHQGGQTVLKSKLNNHGDISKTATIERKYPKQELFLETNLL